mmetsp:Transcript_39589/g.99504  ORF Transcript_39589/g.99504 Transcript_39589/m.99504 type:complete len:273 (-) Transcript_39589:117-935(-)
MMGGSIAQQTGPAAASRPIAAAAFRLPTTSRGRAFPSRLLQTWGNTHRLSGLNLTQKQPAINRRRSHAFCNQGPFTVACTRSQADAPDTESQAAPKTPEHTRRLILLRHAESQEASMDVKDYSREVTQIGKKGAQFVAQQLIKIGWIPDRILCSPSTRTRQTLDAMMQVAESFQETEVKYIESFYTVAALDGHTRPEMEMAIIAEASSSESSTMMCMGHNKGWEEAASSFAGTPIKLGTCNAALLLGAGSTWEEAFTNGFELTGIITPDEDQ